MVWLEFHLGAIVRVMLKLDKKRGRILTVGMGVDVLRGIIHGLCERWVRNALLVGELKRLTDEIWNLKSKRDKFVHGVYASPQKGSDNVYFLSLKKREDRIEPKLIHDSPQEIKRVGVRLRALQEDVKRVLRGLKRELNEEGDL